MYKVEIQFRKGPYLTYSKVKAESKEDAKEKALRSAKLEGFRESVKKVTIKEVI